MTEDRTSMVLAVDGGGTRCRLVLDWFDGRVMVEVGPANVTSDFNSAIREISTGLTKLAEAGDVESETLVALPAHLALAGITGPEMAHRALEALPLAHADVQDDRRAALQGALGEADGAIAHCGTGSFIALRKNGKIRLAGGWGPRLGDEASAQWVGMRALARTLDAVDGLMSHTALTQALLAAHGTAAEIVAFAASAPPASVGEHAQLVTDHASNGDEAAIGILKSGADEIAIRLRKLEWSAGLPVCLTGGMAHVYRSYLPQDISDAIVEPNGKPIDGAVALARRFEKELAA